jgi:catecholate siderophore receptor
MFGRGSTGGIVNQVSKTPSRTPFYEVTATAGTPTTFRATADLNHPLGSQIGVRLNAMFTHTDVAGRDEVEMDRWGVAPSITFGLGGPTRLTLSYFHQEEDNLPDYGVPYLFGEPAPVSKSTFYGFPAKDFERTDVSIATVRLDHEFNEAIKLRNTLRYAIYGREQETTAPRISGSPTPATPLTAITVTRGATARERDDSILANQTDLIVKFDTWGFGHTLVAGVELAREIGDFTTFTVSGTPTSPLLSPNPFASLASVSRRKNQINETIAYTAASYLVDEVEITRQWRILGGFRYDHFEAESDTMSAVTGVRTHLERTDDLVSPRAAILFLPTPFQTYYFSYGNSFNPSAEALTLAVNTVRTSPERTQSFELGAKWDFLDRLSLRAALFRVEKYDARTAEPGSPIQTLDGKQRSQGFELEAVGRILPRWNVFAAYTYLDTEVVESNDVAGGVRIEGKRLIVAPENTFTLWTTYDFLERFQVGGGVTYVDSRFGNTANTNEAPSYVKGDVTLAYRPTKNTEVRLNVLNISDERYYDQVYQAHIVPGAGRSFLFTGTFNF